MAFEVYPFLPIIVHCNTLFRVTFGYFGSTKNLFGSLNFLEPFPNENKELLFKPLEKVLKN